MGCTTTRGIEGQYYQIYGSLRQKVRGQQPLAHALWHSRRTLDNQMSLSLNTGCLCLHSDRYTKTFCIDQALWEHSGSNLSKAAKLDQQRPILSAFIFTGNLFPFSACNCSLGMFSVDHCCSVFCNDRYWFSNCTRHFSNRCDIYLN